MNEVKETNLFEVWNNQKASWEGVGNESWDAKQNDDDVKDISDDSFNEICDAFSAFLDKKNDENNSTKKTIIFDEGRLATTDARKMKFQKSNSGDTDDGDSGFRDYSGDNNSEKCSIDTTRDHTIDDLLSDEIVTSEKRDKYNFLDNDLPNFCDIEDEFFEDEENYALTFKMPLINDEIEPNKKLSIPSTKNKASNKTESMSNRLLRSTISELERALNDSNVLLSRRDEEISSLRHENKRLEECLRLEIETSANTKKQILDKDFLIDKNAREIDSLREQLNLLKEELSDFQQNESKAHDSFTEVKNIMSERETVIDERFNNDESDSSLVGHMGRKEEHTASKQTVCVRQNRKGVPCKRDPVHKEFTLESVDSSSKTCRKTSAEYRSNSGHARKEKQDNSTTKNKSKNKNTAEELEMRLSFLRDAFFYYVIGFHADEQINAIVAILTYGERRRTLLMKAHKMKQQGARVSVTKVSSRFLTMEKG